MGAIRRLISLAAALCAVSPVHGAEFRAIQPIAVPGSGAAAPGPVIRPVARDTVEAAAREVFARYNTPGFARLLAEDFHDGERLVDAVSEQVPRDASLRVLGVQAVQTLGQRISGDVLVSTVSAVVRAQIEFNDPARGFQRREGINELLLRITEPAPP